MNSDNGGIAKIPPHSVEAERALLGSLMLDNASFEDISGLITENDFYLKKHGVIFSAISALFTKDLPFDVLTLGNELQNRGKLEEIGGDAYLFELANGTPTAANLESYAKIVKERSMLRELIKITSSINNKAYFPEGLTCREIIEDAENKIFKIAENDERNKGPADISSILKITYDKIDYLRSLDSDISGLPCGFKDLDEKTSGLQEGDLIIVAGRPSMGKTAFAMNIAEHVAIKEKKTVLVFSMEMPSESLAMRLLSTMGSIDQHKLRTGKIAKEDWSKITANSTILSQTNLFIDDTPALSPSDLRSRARRIAKAHGQIGLIIIDYLQLMQIPGFKENRTAEITEISRALKSLAKELKAPVIALSQLNRGLELRSDKRPQMADLRESGAIEQDADLILFIYRDEVYNENSQDSGTAEIIIAKQRNGPIGKVKLTFINEFTKFADFAEETRVYS